MRKSTTPQSPRLSSEDELDKLIRPLVVYTTLFGVVEKVDRKRNTVTTTYPKLNAHEKEMYLRNAYRLVEKEIAEAKQQILKLIASREREARKNGYNSGWSARNKTKPARYVCEICKEISTVLTTTKSSKGKS